MDDEALDYYKAVMDKAVPLGEMQLYSVLCKLAFDDPGQVDRAIGEMLADEAARALRRAVAR